jgi:thymidylate kinase
VASGGVTHLGTGFIRSHVVDGLVKGRFVVRVANNLSIGWHRKQPITQGRFRVDIMIEDLCVCAMNTYACRGDKKSTCFNFPTTLGGSVMSRPRVIAFIGTVGSGKSTHMKILYSKLKQGGFRVWISYLKRGHLLASLLESLLAKMLAGKRKDVYPIRALLEERPTLLKRIFRLLLSLDLISIISKFLASIYLPSRLGYIVLVEEYIPATISDYIYLGSVINSPLKVNSFFINYLLRLMKLCGPIQIIFLDASNDELKRRWGLRGSHDERKDYLQMQRTLLLRMSRELSSYGLIYIDTGVKTLTEVQKLIMTQILVKD